MKKIFFVLIILILNTSCDSYEKKLDGISFSIAWGNLPELSNLYFNYPSGLGEGILMNRITDVYWNEQYILAKRCAYDNDSVIGYYIVTILPEGIHRVPWEKSELLSEEEYEQAKKGLGLNEQEMKHTNIFKRRFLWW